MSDIVRLNRNSSVIEDVLVMRFVVNDLDSLERIIHSLKNKSGCMAYISVSDKNRFIFRQIYSIFSKQNGVIRRRFLYESGYLGISHDGNQGMVIICGSDFDKQEQILKVTF